MAASSNYYVLLGIPRTASAAEVRQAYLRLAKERHPDRFPDPAAKAAADEFLKELTAAYNTLSNERARKQYDAELDEPRVIGPEAIARDAFTRGVQHFKSQDYQGAAEFFRIAIHHQPDVAVHHAALGRALGHNPAWARQAIEALERATQLEPQSAVYHADLAKQLHQQGLKLRARKAIEAALRLSPHDAAIRKLAAKLGAGGPPAAEGGAKGPLRRP